jgi:hypothetical protein
MRKGAFLSLLLIIAAYSYSANNVIPSGARVVNPARTSPAATQDPIPDIKIKKGEIEYIKKAGALRYYKLINGTLIVTRKNNILFVKEKGKPARKIDKRMSKIQLELFIDIEVLQDEADTEFENSQRPVNFSGAKFIRKKGKFKMYRLPKGDVVIISFITIVAVKMKNGSLKPVMRILSNQEKKLLSKIESAVNRR